VIEELLDYGELRGLLDEKLVPSPDASKCFVSRGTDGVINGYVFSQAMITVEPIWVDETQRGSGLALKLFSHAAQSLAASGRVRYFVTHSDSDKVTDYLKRLGMEELNWKTFKMELKQGQGG